MKKIGSIYESQFHEKLIDWAMMRSVEIMLRIRTFVINIHNIECFNSIKKKFSLFYSFIYYQK